MKQFLLTLLLGVAVGALGMAVIPRYFGFLLPDFLTPEQRVVEGQVVAKRIAPEGLLLTIETPEGAVLATFSARTEEIDLLVDQGDSIAFGLKMYKPFLEDPEIARVRKAAAQPPEPLEPAVEPETVPEPEPSPEPAGATGVRPPERPEADLVPREASEPTGEDGASR